MRLVAESHGISPPPSRQKAQAIVVWAFFSSEGSHGYWRDPLGQVSGGCRPCLGAAESLSGALWAPYHALQVTAILHYISWAVGMCAARMCCYSIFDRWMRNLFASLSQERFFLFGCQIANLCWSEMTFWFAVNALFLKCSMIDTCRVSGRR